MDNDRKQFREMLLKAADNPKIRGQKSLVLTGARDEVTGLPLVEAHDTATVLRSIASSDICQPHAVYLGGGKIQIGDEMVVLTLTQAEALEVLIDLGGACSKRQLQEGRGDEYAPRRLREIVKQYPLVRRGRYIKTPGRKGQGGYTTTIRRPWRP
ncbi:MAG TPA: hypothetical protein VMP01_14075 [Pirellulaceae bacterium]|nr:hypothetical protein [Pirellulaceae bacterium]